MPVSSCCRATVMALALTLVTAPVSLAAAQRAPTANEIALARQEFDAGMLAARDTQWEQARLHFTRSYELAPRPVTLLNLAGAQAQTGQLVAASESYRRFMSTASERDAERYRAQAEEALAAAEARFGHTQLQLDGLLTADEVRLDDAPLSRASLSLTLPLDPGDHLVTVHRRGREVGRTAFHVAEGETSTVAVSVVSSASVPTPDDAARSTLGPPTEAAEASRLRVGTEPAPAVDDYSGGLFASPWFWLVTGVVVAGAATAVIVVATSDGAPQPFQGTLRPGSIVVD